MATKRNKFESVELRWTNLEPVLQSEVSQKEKNTMLMHVYGREISIDISTLPC